MLSIIIPTLNEEDYLPYLLSTIKRQTYQNYEVIVADANSHDHTCEIVKEYGYRIIKGGTPAAGRNTGAKNARGDLLLFLDADVLLPNDFLEKSLKEFNSRRLNIASCFISPLSETKIDKFLFVVGNLYYRINQYIQPRAPGFCIFIKKQVHYQINGFNEKIKLAEDWDYIKRASGAGRFKFLQSTKIPVFMRRPERDGRLHFGFQQISLAAYTHLIGTVKSDALFRYRFGGYPDHTLKPVICNYTKFHKQNYADRI